jgi:hypothetical protein
MNCEISHEAAVGSFVNVGCLSYLQDLASIHYRDAVRHGQSLFLVVGHIDEGDAQSTYLNM